MVATRDHWIVWVLLNGNDEDDVVEGDLRLDTHTDEGEDTDKDEGDKDAADVDDVNINGIFL